ncbi:hypothetical protein F4776DRAFT_502564 [Hypoxylon sp. NC0597]|nr:hypothetical protein F4776DRAFT_502564 [Hypoxylon sp. NC0597]
MLSISSRKVANHHYICDLFSICYWVNMESLAHNRALSTLEDVIKQEVESKLMNLRADDMVHIILRRQDSQAIQVKLFSHLDGAKFSDMISTREDSRAIYVDLFKQVIAKVDSLSQAQDQRHSNAPSGYLFFHPESPICSSGARPKCLGPNVYEKGRLL